LTLVRLVVKTPLAPVVPLVAPKVPAVVDKLTVAPDKLKFVLPACFSCTLMVVAVVPSALIQLNAGVMVVLVASGTGVLNATDAVVAKLPAVTTPLITTVPTVVLFKVAV